MRYYASMVDFASLEPVMRLQGELLQAGEEKKIQDIGFIYLKMEFARMNALLYRHEGMNRQAADETEAFCKEARACFAALKRERGLSEEQSVYLGWACSECLSEAVQIYDTVLDAGAAAACRSQAVEVLDWLCPCLSGCGLWDARAVLAKTLYSLQEFLYSGSQKLLLECEREVELVLSGCCETDREHGIVLAAKELVLVQKGRGFLQGGQPDG